LSEPVAETRLSSFGGFVVTRWQTPEGPVPFALPRGGWVRNRVRCWLIL
jgi:hypothetical protein